MTSKRPLMLASIMFAVIWTALMIYLNSPLEIAGMVIFAIAGAIAGGLWYLGMRWWMDRTMIPTQ